VRRGSDRVHERKWEGDVKIQHTPNMTKVWTWKFYKSCAVLALTAAARPSVASAQEHE
jgi:hypothetical protein